MGKLTNGLLGPVSGRVGGVVGANWKGVRYLRSYVVPGASNTDAQIAQRARFSAVVIPAKYFVTRVFNPFYDKFLTRASGFNQYVSRNIPKAPDYTPITAHAVTSGPLHPGSALAMVLDTGTDVVTVTWGTELGIDGLATDVAIAWVRSRTTGTVWFSANSTRTAGTITITGVTEAAAATLDGGMFFAKLTGAIVNKISTNLNCQPT